jgi:hypothetical protein
VQSGGFDGLREIAAKVAVWTDVHAVPVWALGTGPQGKSFMVFGSQYHIIGP